ncbi:MAG: NAD(P)H-hydrate dehydratase [Candidatus Solibacter usitatus]|nr:NAD(P)H-hydrate dehydratase [Candidatus Solibacter usitatus]
MKVLTAAQMREVDRRTIAAGVPGLILMENAAHRVVEFLANRFAPLSAQRIVVLCGKGNNGGDGLAIARQLHTRFSPCELHVALIGAPSDPTGDAAANVAMLEAVGVPMENSITPAMRRASLVVDAVLGTGIKEPARGVAADWIHQINTGFPDAKVIAVDLPSGMDSDAADNLGPCARADASVTFTAPRICHALPPNCDRVGELLISPIGTSAALCAADPELWLSLCEPSQFAFVTAPRPRAAHKGSFGHVLIAAGSRGKTGAAAMSGIAALRSGAGLVTVATAATALSDVAAHCPELMTEPLAETENGAVSMDAYTAIHTLAAGKTVAAAGPGMGTDPSTFEFLRALYARLPVPLIVDADAINALAGFTLNAGAMRILTPHPGEMARLAGCTTAAVQRDRVSIARDQAVRRGAVIVLKGQRTLIAFPDGRVFINPTGTPAMATAGSGDILTGMLAGLLAQWPDRPEECIAAAVWLHGRAGELGAASMGEHSLIATDLLRFLPEAMRDLSR